MDTSKFYYLDGSPFHGIFKEIPLTGQYMKEVKPPVYTVQEAHDIYMECMNEYDAALKLTPSWEYWKGMLKASMKVRKVVEDWREEKMFKDQARARALLWEQAEKGNVSAQRILYESKKEEAQQRQAKRSQEKKQAAEQSTLEERYERLTQMKVV